MSPVYAAKLRQIESLCKELQTLMKPKQIGPWLLTEMEEFENRTPADLMARGGNRANLGFCVLSEIGDGGLTSRNSAFAIRRLCWLLGFVCDV